MIYTLTLNPSLDYVMNCNINIGETNRSEFEEIYPGGKGINISMVLKELGMDSIAIGVEGGFTGQELLRLLDNKIKYDFIHINNYKTRINVKLKGNNITEINSRGISLNNVDILLSKLSKIKAGDYLVLSGSCNPNNLYKEIIINLPAGVKIILDTTADILKETIISKPFLIKPNYDELNDYFNYKTDDINMCLRQLQRDGAKNVLLSMGEMGAYLAWDNCPVIHIPALKEKAVNTVGAGDSMVAGFLYSYINGLDHISALKMAVACGCSTAFSQWLTDKKGAEYCYDKINLLLKEKT